MGVPQILKMDWVMNADPVKFGGGAKCLASPEHETDREFVEPIECAYGGRAEPGAACESLAVVPGATVETYFVDFEGGRQAEGFPAA
ncbi:MAG TPA: hypothetical protein VGG72_28075 [Bryobacteraceae bacterium]|jgi:hypothetical protein